MFVILQFGTVCLCVRESLRLCSGFVSVETLESIEESRADRLAVNRDQFRALSHRLELY